MNTTNHILVLLACFYPATLQAQYVPLSEEMDAGARISVEHLFFVNDRREAIENLICPFQPPPKARIVIEEPESWTVPVMSWRRGITATVFWVGEKSSERNPTPNNASSWDPNWQANFGGVDHPAKRKGFAPANFTPKLNPFYIALPYNDISPSGKHHPEASQVIPWFWKSYRGSWTSVCKGKWVAIHYRGKICYAQWEDCGPFRTDDWEYVFKGHKPKPNPNSNAGIDISPAVRDYLGIRSGYRVAWKFIENDEIPNGPWDIWTNH